MRYGKGHFPLLEGFLAPTSPEKYEKCVDRATVAARARGSLSLPLLNRNRRIDAECIFTVCVRTKEATIPLVDAGTIMGATPAPSSRPGQDPPFGDGTDNGNRHGGGNVVAFRIVMRRIE